MRIKLQQLQQQDTAASLDEMVRISTNIFYKEAKAQKRERRKETRHARILAALQESTMANTKSLKDKARANA